MKEAWIYMRSQHLFTRKQEKFFKDTTKFTPKQCNRHQSQEMEAANKTVPARLGTGWAKADSNGCKELYQAIAVVITRRTDQLAKQEGKLIHLFWEKGFSVTLRWLSAIWAKCQQNITFFLPAPSWRSSHANRFCRSENERIWDLI